jgi:excisionase family DNA binding protein
MVDTKKQCVKGFRMKTYMNTDEVAMFLGRSPKAIRTLVERGQLPHRRLGRRIIFVRTELEQFVHMLPGMDIQDIQRRWNHL